MNVVCFLFARGGSKSIKNKNLLKFDKHPLIVNTIKQALRVKLFTDVIISSDSKKIIKISTKYGAKCSSIRPKKLSTDKSPEYLSWKYEIKNYEKNYGKKIDIFVSLPCTSPLRKDSDIIKALKIYKKNHSNNDMLVSLTKTNHYPGFNIAKINKHKNFEIFGKTKFSRRQDVKNIFNISTCFYIAKRDYLLSSKKNPLFGGKKIGYIVDRKSSIDIDDRLDFKIAKILKNEK